MIDLSSAGDSVLVVAVGRWSEPALAEVYRRHGGAVHSLVSRMVGSDRIADDVTQEVFLALWQRPESFDPSRGSLRTYLLAKTHGRAVDVLRSETARSDREHRSARETAGAGYDIERHAWDLAIADQLKRAMDTLPELERKPIELAYFHGRTYREVASMLEEPEGTIKSRIRAGLRRLRGVMAREGTAWVEQ